MKKVISLSIFLFSISGFSQELAYAAKKYKTTDKKVTVYTTTEGSKNRLSKTQENFHL